MSLFDWLLIGHLAGDFLFQSDGMARQKAEDGMWILRHVGVYMLFVTPILVTYAVSHRLPAWLAACAWLFIFLTHTLLDQRAFTRWWMRTVGTAPDQVWLSIVIDQVFHLLTLAAVAQVFAWATTWGGGVP